MATAWAMGWFGFIVLMFVFSIAKSADKHQFSPRFCSVNGLVGLEVKSLAFQELHGLVEHFTKHIIDAIVVFEYIKSGNQRESPVALVNPPYPVEAPQAIFLPLGIGYLTAVLEENGYTVDVVDCQTTHPTQKELEDKFRSLNPDIIGVTSATLTYNPALDIFKLQNQRCQTF